VAVALAVPTLLAASPSGANAQAPALPAGFETAWAEVRDDWRSAVEEAGIVGSTLAFVKDGRIVRRAHHGMENLAEGRPVDAGTLYHWASITKTFTAVALMQLVERGMVALDDPAVAYVPELAGVHDPFGPVGAITLEHLLSHSAGFRASTWPWGGDEPWHPWEPTEWSQLVAMMPYTEVLFEPGSRFSYSNPGIIFLGRTLEAVTGDVYESYVEKNVLRPLAMRTAYFDVTPWRLRDDRSENYRVVEGKPVANGDFNTGITVSNGGLNATVDDLARWLAFLSGHTPDGADPAEAAGVLSRKTLREMWEPRVSMGPVADEQGGIGQERMGLSFFLYDTADGARVVGHTGSQRSFFSFIYLDPATGAGAVAAFNTAGGDDTGPDTRAVLNRVRARVFHDLLPLFRDGAAGGPAAPDPEGGPG
jgi:CubicO group peptidase (beta-lactamase class C family)